MGWVAFVNFVVIEFQVCNKWFFYIALKQDKKAKIDIVNSKLAEQLRRLKFSTQVCFCIWLSKQYCPSLCVQSCHFHFKTYQEADLLQIFEVDHGIYMIMFCNLFFTRLLIATACIFKNIVWTHHLFLYHSTSMLY